jgi:hypothetical protein
VVKAARPTPIMKPKSPPKISATADTPRSVGTLTTKTLKPGKFGGHISVASFGSTETHRVSVFELKPEDRATLEGIAKRYRVKSLTRFLEGCLAAEDRKGSEQILFRIYED